MTTGHTIITGECREQMGRMDECSVDAIVTDPPYGLAFMGAEWDSFGSDTRQPGDEHYVTPDNPFGRSKARYGYGKNVGKSMTSYQERMTPVFEEALRVAKSGAHMLCFGGTRTFHRMACAIEDAGWEIRDTIMWVYGSGFPKSMDVAKAIDKQRRDDPRPVCRYLRDAIERSNETTATIAEKFGFNRRMVEHWAARDTDSQPAVPTIEQWVSLKDILGLDSSMDAEVERLNERKGEFGDDYKNAEILGKEVLELMGDAQRFFYCAKASKRDRGEGNDHPTVKPTPLMQWLVRLVCPSGGLVMDPFCGSGSTGVACVREGMRFLGIEMDARYAETARGRIEAEIEKNVDA